MCEYLCVITYGHMHAPTVYIEPLLEYFNISGMIHCTGIEANIFSNHDHFL